MQYTACDHVPYFEEGIRDEVLTAWRAQGMPKTASLVDLFAFDRRVEIELDLDPYPAFKTWPHGPRGLQEFNRRLDPTQTRRFPRDWPKLVKQLEDSEAVRLLRVHRGLFLSMGVVGWERFFDLMLLLGRDPQYVREAMHIQSAFATALCERVLEQVAIDAAIFSEPIGGNAGPLISPDMYEEIVLQSYTPLFQLLTRYGVGTLIFRTYANARILMPAILERGFNCLWAHEVNVEAMDYRALRREYGRNLRLIGGIDLDCLRQGRSAIRRELESKLPSLLAQGGYIPLADGRIRPDVRYADYVYYRQLLQEITQSP
jgi:hypothetical protein